MQTEQEKYRVLARKYRPHIFSDLIGQESLVQTITNAIEQNRLAQAYILTGIRGIGKTSSARIIARAFNCVGLDGKGGMTPNPCGVCRHCQDIANDCHVDVVEIDAASNTGIDNIRDIIIEGAKYNPVSARYKIYIIDEVHMLSKPAFNALLKTLEEPPERLKFIFATTEIRKVPVTILSRCQRFDLRRISEKTLADYFKIIAEKEKISIDNESLQLIAKVADGSVRDGLSLLDQAIVHGNGHVNIEQVRSMIGISEKTALFDLYEKLMKGQIVDVLSLVQNQYYTGVDLLTLNQDLLELTHWLTRVKIVPEMIKDVTLTDVQKTQGKKMAESLSMGTLTRTWQILLKGYSEMKCAESPLKSFEMLMIRLAYASELPSPSEIISDLKKNVVTDLSSAQKKTDVVQKIQPSTKKELNSFPSFHSTSPQSTVIRSISDLVVMAKKAGQMLLAFNMSNYIQPVQITETELHLHLKEGAPNHLLQDIRSFLLTETSKKWEVISESVEGGKTLKEEAEDNRQKIKQTLCNTPLIIEILDTFKGARVENFRIRSDLEEEPSSPDNTLDE